MESLFTAKCTLVPSDFYEQTCQRDYLSQVACLSPDEEVSSLFLPDYSAWLLWAHDKGVETLPEMYYILGELRSGREYNKIVCSWAERHLYIAVAQGKSLLLANTYEAADFTAAQYYIFLALKSLQLNPEVSTVRWRTPLDQTQQLSLYRYFKAVEQL